jgi:mannose-1-phosphate guanylyltransferase
MLHAVIMAGGAGTRFWPESRGARPKQLLPLAGPRTMIQATLDRLEGLIPTERTLVVTNERLAAAIAEQLPSLPRDRILGEPCRRDTAPCIGWAAFTALRDDAEATLLMLPADHVIDPTPVFQAAVRQAAALVGESPGRIVTFGIPPTYPAESFGYIHRGELLPTKQPAAAGKTSAVAYSVRRFREKPNAAVAREYLAAGGFYWNSGIFVWRASTILEAIARHQPDMHRRLQSISVAAGTPVEAEVLQREFAAIRGISIDYAVMEHADDVAVIEAPFSWDDVGSWQALARLRGEDDSGNTVAAEHVGIDTQHSILRGPAGHLIVTLGVSDLIVVHTPDVTLVADRRREESIRQLVKLLEERGLTEYL